MLQWEAQKYSSRSNNQINSMKAYALQALWVLAGMAHYILFLSLMDSDIPMQVLFLKKGNLDFC